MTFLLDANLSPRLVGRLINSGYEATHVAALWLLTAPDEVIFDHAADADLIVITADTDFSMLLALRNAARPSVVLLRHVAELRARSARRSDRRQPPARQGRSPAGAVVSLSPTRLPVRRLPIDAAGPTTTAN